MKVESPFNIVEVVSEGEVTLAQIMLDDFLSSHSAAGSVLFTDVNPDQLCFHGDDKFSGLVSFIRPVSSLEDRCVIYSVYRFLYSAEDIGGLYIYNDGWEYFDLELLTPKQALSLLNILSTDFLSWRVPVERLFRDVSSIGGSSFLALNGEVGFKVRESYLSLIYDIESMQRLIWCPARLEKKDDYKNLGASLVKFARPIYDEKKSRLKSLGLSKLKDVVDVFFDGATIGSSRKINYSSDVWPYIVTVMSCWFYRASLVYKRSGLISEAIMSLSRSLEFCFVSKGMRDGVISLTQGAGRVVVNGKEVTGIGGLVTEMLYYSSIEGGQRSVEEVWPILAIRNNSKLAHGVLDIDEALYDDSLQAYSRVVKKVYDKDLFYIYKEVNDEIGRSPLVEITTESLKKELLHYFTITK
ncbi:hypothetical protein [Halomonas sp. 11-S5]|uniref:hypothetical protein n=1 Tax=Halomonas sp. 11-S5 TaxID=2994064 RepID=UPI0024691E90|nr:hypothetical protein [Halomonas sp. 11-S5]